MAGPAAWSSADDSTTPPRPPSSNDQPQQAGSSGSVHSEKDAAVVALHSVERDGASSCALDSARFGRCRICLEGLAADAMEARSRRRPVLPCCASCLLSSSSYCRGIAPAAAGGGQQK